MLWYTRRNGVVRGPYPKQQISRYILLGRIRHSDELRCEEGDWQSLSAFPQLIPDVMQLPPTEENLRRLLRARMREDERRTGDRRLAPEHRLAERRRQEPPELTPHRDARRRALADVFPRSRGRYRHLLALSALVTAAFLFGYSGRVEQPPSLTGDCAAAPQPGVNWNRCNLAGLHSDYADLTGAQARNATLDAAQLSGARLAGADLAFSSLALSNLRSADLSGANLRGAMLRGSDLRHARLAAADLSYANLSGVRLEGANLRGAILDHSIWSDHRVCAAGSVGECRRSKAQPPHPAQ